MLYEARPGKPPGTSDYIPVLESATSPATTPSPATAAGIAYTYDKVGNRLSSLNVSPYSYNSSNQLTSKPGVTYSYDNNGNLLSKVDATGTTSYAWDFENRLVSVTLPGTGGTVTIKYDPFGRRIQKSSATVTSVFAYDGDNLIQEVNASGAAVTRYTQGLGIDEPLAMYRSGVASYYHADGLASIAALTNATGFPTTAYVYDSFGNLVATAGNVVNSFRYTARELDPETSLYYYRARYFDPSIGRFLSEDPLRFDAGNDFYAYADNNPAVFIDPWGLEGSTGGPEHPAGPFACTCKDDCAVLSAKIEIFKRVIADHTAWDVAHQTNKHGKEIADFQNGLENWIQLHRQKCTNKPPRVPVLAPSPQAVRKVANVATGAVVAYAIYRIVRLIPSLLPPLWPTLPANAVIP